MPFPDISGVLAVSCLALWLGLRLRRERKQRKEAADLHRRAMHSLAAAIDARDSTAPGHLLRLAVYATGLGAKLGLNAEELRALETAALWHDVGELAVPEHIIAKPSRLTVDEMEKIKTHPAIASEILDAVGFPYPVSPIVRAHHERWDGSGYPLGLKGEEIPIGARILAAVDSLNTLATDRKYRPRLPLPEAMRVVEAQSGKCFDPAVIEALRKSCFELERKAREAAAGHSVGAFATAIASARREYHEIYELANELGDSLNLKETLSRLSRRLKPLVPYDAIAFWLTRGNRLVAEYVHGEIGRLTGAPEISSGEGPSGKALQSNRSVVNADPAGELRCLTSSGAALPLRAAISVPLEGVSGPIGAMTLYHQSENAFTPDHLRVLRAVRPKAGLTIENAIRFEQAATSAVTDELTGLPNARSLFTQLHLELNRCKRTFSTLVLLMVDLDGFKDVNDRFGHVAGNKVLQLTAEGLRACCREYDYVARMGGDEFVLILPGAEPDLVLAKLLQLDNVARRAGAEVCGEQVVSLSVGDAFFPADGDDAEQLLALADRRMYQMKEAHRMRQVYPSACDRSYASNNEVAATMQ